MIAVLDWNRYEATRRCVLSLAPLRERGATILIVDNASREPEAEQIAAELGPGHEPLTLASNGGVAGGYTEALRWAAAREASHVLLLNNDTVLNDTALADHLMAACGDRVAVAGPQILEEDGQLNSAGAWIDWRRGRTRHVRALPSAPGVYAAEWVHGSCMMIRLDAYRAIGGFDRRFFMYWEDIDWCVRAWGAGWRCVIEPAASITHIGGLTAPSAQSARLILRNSLFLMRKHGSSRDHAIFLAYYLVRRLPSHVLRHAWPPSQLREAFSAVTDALAWNLRQARRAGSWRLPGLRTRPHDGEAPIGIPAGAVTAPPPARRPQAVK